MAVLENGLETIEPGSTIWMDIINNNFILLDEQGLKNYIKITDQLPIEHTENYFYYITTEKSIYFDDGTNFIKISNHTKEVEGHFPDTSAPVVGVKKLITQKILIKTVIIYTENYQGDETYTLRAFDGNNSELWSNDYSLTGNKNIYENINIIVNKDEYIRIDCTTSSGNKNTTFKIIYQIEEE